MACNPIVAPGDTWAWWTAFCKKKVPKPLDKGIWIIRIDLKSCFMQLDCEHVRTQMIARRDGVEYLECLDCRQIFEAEDLEPVTVDDDDD